MNTENKEISNGYIRLPNGAMVEWEHPIEMIDSTVFSYNGIGTSIAHRTKAFSFGIISPPNNPVWKAVKHLTFGNKPSSIPEMYFEYNDTITQQRCGFVIYDCVCSAPEPPKPFSDKPDYHTMYIHGYNLEVITDVPPR